MIGQGRPTACHSPCSRSAAQQIWSGPLRPMLLHCLVVLHFILLGASSHAAEKTVRLRLAWGSGNAAKQRWTGVISVDNGLLTELQPLGVEVDASVAVRIDGSRLLINPLVKRGFDGCDVTVRADEQATVRVELRNDQTPQPAAFEAKLSEIVSQPLQRPLDEFGSYFLARRSPGDVLRVLPTRDHLVFEPGEVWQLNLEADLSSALADGPFVLDVRLLGTNKDKPSWQASQQISEVSQLQGGIGFEIPCPTAEGAYRLQIAAQPQESLATRFVPGKQVRPIATREVEFVVIDPAAKLPLLVDHWLPVLTIDPANPSWWQRLPAWAQVPRLRGRTPGSVGNVRPVVRPTPTGELLELPPAPSDGDPYWQSYTLPVRKPGQAHMVEIEYPLGSEQHLTLSLVEPDAAGKVTTTEQDSSLIVSTSRATADGEVGVHRFVIWPRTRSPQLLIVNRHKSLPGQFGKIRLMRQDTALASLTEPPSVSPDERLVACYLSRPLLAENFGAAESLDLQSGLSVHSWTTFLDSAKRLAQSLRFAGYNGVMISVAADGSSLYPSRLLNPSPRYDNGLLAANGQDPLRKDVVEMLLRVFDREGIRVIPSVQLAAPLPRLEAQRQAANTIETGVECVDYDGRTFSFKAEDSTTLRQLYNPLNEQVQAELVGLVRELSTRYSDHPSFSGVGVQVSSNGYGMLPGLAWGFDDSTVTQFSSQTGIRVPGDGANRFRQRAVLLLGEQRKNWARWRQQRVSELYQQMAEEVTAARDDLQLVVATEELFSSDTIRKRVRWSITESHSLVEILADYGVDLAGINAHPAIRVTMPHRLKVAASVQATAIESRVNSAVELAELLPSYEHEAALYFHESESFQLSSFDERSPFGTEQTYLTASYQHQAAGVDRQQHIIRSLANHDPQSFIEGGKKSTFSSDERLRELLHTVRQLPSSQAEIRTYRHQPVVMRVYRKQNATIIALINESPWAVRAEVGIASPQATNWSRLGSGSQAEISQLAGELSSEGQLWQADLQPYDLQAWRFEDPELRIGELSVVVAEIAQQELRQRINEIEARAGNLNVKRPYTQLQNPGFELQEGDFRIIGWQPRQGTVGAVMLDSEQSHSGNQALRLQSSDATGVAAQSHLFPCPNTGQLMVSVFLWVNQIHAGSQFRITVQDQHNGRDYQQYAVLTSNQLSGSGWLRYELPLGDVPADPDGQLRLNFHLTGEADVLVDDVELFDLRFDESRRLALIKRIHGANIALEQGQLLDCLRVVDDYWSRYLVEHVPPTGAIETLAAKPETVTEPSPSAKPTEEETGIGSRLRGWVPSIWR